MSDTVIRAIVYSSWVLVAFMIAWAFSPRWKKKRAKAKRGWNMPGNYTNWILFITHDDKRIVSLEKGEKLEEVLEDMTVKIGKQHFYKLTYPNSPSTMQGDEPENHEQTPYLQMLLPHTEVSHVWMQREYKGPR